MIRYMDMNTDTLQLVIRWQFWVSALDPPKSRWKCTNVYLLPLISPLVAKPFKVRPITEASKRYFDPCMICGRQATKEALFNEGDVISAKRFCDKCLSKAQKKVSK